MAYIPYPKGIGVLRHFYKMKETVENLRQELPNYPYSNAVDIHPSYRMVSINRQQCSRGDKRS